MTEMDAAELESPVSGRSRLDMLVIGMGFGGMCMLHRARAMGLDVHAIEAGEDVGGTWYWNRYPGARCDVMSIDYSYSFDAGIQQDWSWTEKFAAQPEIFAYARFVADRLDLRRDTSFATRATSIAYDDARNLWVVVTDQGQVFEATYCVMATGPLSIPKGIDVPGQESFGGDIYLSGRWPHHNVDFAGKRVGIIGTGSTGIQAVPVVAETAAHLTVFQRTPSFTIPMRNRALSPDYMAQVKAHYPRMRAIARSTHTGGLRPVSTRPLFSVPAEEARRLLEDGWNEGGQAIFGLFSDLLTDQATNDVVAAFVRGKIREMVEDPHTAEVLTPRGYPIFTRRPCLDTNYYETFNRDNVSLVDCLNEPIVEIVPGGVRTTARDIDLDIIIGATGYDGLTGAMMAVDITGRGGRSLREKWAGGARSYLGLMMEGFPNLFMIAGANGPSALAVPVILNEQNAEWIVGCIAHLRATGAVTIEPTPGAEDEYMTLLTEIAGRSLIPKAKSWYVGANIPGKANFFPIFAGGFSRYVDMCNAAAARDYAGFVIAPAAAVAAEMDLATLIDEAAIKSLHLRYCRGVDRLDWDLVRSCYHPDATDDHGSYTGGIDGFIEWASAGLPRFESTTHFTGNQLVEVDGDTAWAEHYAIVFHRRPASADALPADLIANVRYIDRVERRNSIWRIAKRVVVADANTVAPVTATWLGDTLQASRRDRSDPSYRR